MSKQLVTVYSVRFKGIFGRNRSVKVHYGRDVVGPVEPIGAYLDGYLEDLVDKAVTEIKPKAGQFSVVRYLNCESDTYHCKYEDKIVTSLVIPITQGETVYKREVA